MKDTLLSLADLLVAAAPTVFFLAFLTFYLNVMLFKPIAKIFDERRKATEGVRELARLAYESADKKSSEFERALDLAKTDIHRQQEAWRRQWSEEQAAAIAKVRSECEVQIQQARRDIALQVEQQQGASGQTAELLGACVVETLLQRRTV